MLRVSNMTQMPDSSVVVTGLRSEREGLVPNMTQMPDAHVVSAFDLTLPGRRLYTDVSGRVIGRGSPATPGGIVWFGGGPYHSVPNSTPRVLLPLQKRKR